MESSFKASSRTTLALYRRSLGLLSPEWKLVTGLAAAGIAVAAVQLAEAVLFGRVVDALSAHAGAFMLIGWWAAIGMFGIVASVVMSVLSDRLAHRRELAIMREAFERAILLPSSYHTARGSGAVVRTVQAGSAGLFWIWLPTFREQFTALFGVLFLLPTGLAMDVRMAAILGVLSLAYTLSNVIVIGKTARGQQIAEGHQNEVSSRLSDVIGNVSVVQSYTRLAAEISAMRDLMTSVLTARYPVLTWWGLLTVLQRSAATLSMVLVLALGAALARRGELSVGQIVSFASFAALLIGKLDQLSSFVIRTNNNLPAVANLFELMDARSEIVEQPGAARLQDVKGAIRYDAVSFRYPGESTQGVFDISFDVLPGQTVALVGPTGSGKSTTLALLQRMLEREGGSISIDDQDIRSLTLESLRFAMAVVFQDAGLFNRSVAENIEIGRPGADRAAIEQAARLAEAHEFITQKPGGYDFVIGERGAALSGGERQRLAIARAMLKQAPILLLDEATSALDAATEATIKRALDRLRADRTTLIIAHRLSTVADADQILVLERGRIVERGTFRQLVAQGGLFAHLVREGGFSEPESVCDGRDARDSEHTTHTENTP